MKRWQFWLGVLISAFFLYRILQKVDFSLLWENLRTAKAIGASLQAEVTLFCDDAKQADLAKLGDELRFALITSAAQTAPLADAPADAVVTEVEGLKLKILKSAHAKCGRCWHFRADVGSHAAHPELCGRCVSNIEGEGEVRKHA